MDLKTVTSKVEKGIYFTQKEFENDIDLIWSNAMLFNQEGEQIYNMALELQTEFAQVNKQTESELIKKRKIVQKKEVKV